MAQETPAALADAQEEVPTGGMDYVPSAPAAGAHGASFMLKELGYAAQNTRLQYEAGSDRVHHQVITHVGSDVTIGATAGGPLADVVCGYDGVGNLLDS